MDMMHRKAPREEMIDMLHPYKSGWQHILRMYDHSREEYLQNVCITVIYRPDAHEERCAYAHITTEMSRRAGIGGYFYHAFHNTKDTLIREAQTFGGLGTTIVEHKRTPLMSCYNLQSHFGQRAFWHTSPGFKRQSHWVHRAGNSEGNQENTSRPNRVNVPRDDEDEIVYPPLYNPLPPTPVDREEFTLGTSRQRLRRPPRRTTN